MDSFLRDVRYAVRQIVAQRSTAAIAIVTLAIGIGANVSVFSLVDALLFKPAAVREPESLVWLSPREERPTRYAKWSMRSYRSFAGAARSFDGVAAFAERAITLGGEPSRRVSAHFVSANFFDVVGVRPRLGRTFLPQEDASGGGIVAVIAHDLWINRFAGDPSIIGQRIVLNSQPATVIGILPSSFSGLSLTDRGDVWLTMAQLPAVVTNEADAYEHGQWLRAVARVRHDATLESAAAEAGTMAQPFFGEMPARRDPLAPPAPRPGRVTIAVEPVSGGLLPSNRAKAAPVLSLVVLVPLLVVVVATANVANLLIARSVQRRKEFAVRRALGASRGRLARQIMTETMILALLAGVAGVIVASWMTAGISMLGSVPAQFAEALTPSGRVLGATFALTLAVGALFGALSAFTATRESLTPALRNQSITLRVGRSAHRLRDGFVVGQVSVSLLLLITAGLFVRSLAKALDVPLGFDAHGVATMTFDARAQGYDDARSDALNSRLLDALAREPGISDVGLATALPLGSGGARIAVSRDDGVPNAGPGTPGSAIAGRGAVSPGYFAALRIAMIRGRDFSERDTRTSPKVAAIDEALAQRLWPNDDAIGKRLRVGFRDGSTVEVVGVVATTKTESLTELEAGGYVFVPVSQDDAGSAVSLVVRSSLGTPAATDAARRAMKMLDPALPLYDVGSMERIIEGSVAAQRAAAAMLGVLGTLALGLAALGLYGVMAQSVAARTREIGIRMSLGARSAEVVRGFVRDGLVLTLVGAAIGVGMSLVASRALGSLLFGLTATDGLTFGYACALLGVVALVASVIPARRAARVDPVTALRAE